MATLKLIHHVYSRAVWFCTFVLLLYLFATERLGFWGFILIIICGSVVANILDPGESLGDKTAKKLKEEYDERIRQHDEKIKQYSEAASQHIADALKASSRQVVGEIRMKRLAVEQLRNLLLKHHNMKGTDKEYQESRMAKDTTSFIQSMNEALAKTPKSQES